MHDLFFKEKNINSGLPQGHQNKQATKENQIHTYVLPQSQSLFRSNNSIVIFLFQQVLQGFPVSLNLKNSLIFPSILRHILEPY